MKLRLASSRFQILLGFVIGHILVGGAVILFSRDRIVELMCLVALSISVGVLRVFYPIVVEAIQHDKLDGSDLLAMGAFAKSLSLTILTAWIIGNRLLFGELPALRESVVLIYILFLSGYGGALYMTSEGALPGLIPRREWLRAGTWAALGVFLFGLFLLLVV